MSARPPKVDKKLVPKKPNDPFALGPDLLRMFPMFKGFLSDAKRGNEAFMILRTLYKNTKGTNTSTDDDTQITNFNLHDAAEIKANVERTIGKIEERIDRVTRTGGKHLLEFTITLTHLPGKANSETMTVKFSKFPLTAEDKKKNVDFIQSFFNTHLNPPAALLAPAPADAAVAAAAPPALLAPAAADAGAAAAALPAPADAGARAPAAADAKAAADAGAMAAPAPAAAPPALLAPVPAPAPAQDPAAGAAAADAKVVGDAVAAPPAPEDRVAPPAPARRVAPAAVRFAPPPASARPAADPAIRLSAASKPKVRF